MSKKKVTPREIQLIYIGDRMNGDEFKSAFIQADDKDQTVLFFKRRKFWFIGSLYKGEVNAEGTATLYYSSQVGELPEDDKRLPLWRKESHAHSMRWHDVQKRKRADKITLSSTTLGWLREEIKGLKSSDVEHFLNYLMKELVYKPEREELMARINKASKKVKS